MLSFRSVLLLSLLLVVEGQIISNGQCDFSIEPMQDFDFDEYLGTWFEVSRTPNIQGGDCAVAHYAYNETTGLVDAYHSAVDQNFYSSVSGTIRPVGDDDAGSLVFTYTFDEEVREINYWILDSVFQLYALVYSCTNINDQQRSISVWKLSRTTTLTENIHVYLDVLIDNIDGVSSEDLVATDHSADACFQLPELDEGTPVVLTGQCPDIAVVRELDIERYMGVWHDISSYPTDYPSYGTCNNANYSIASSEEIQVVNYFVFDQALNSFNGSIRMTEDGKLIVNFEEGAVESEYWILGTDYDNYALLYNCVNLNEQQMRVWSWKLSRSRQLSTESSAAIDAITNNIIVLNDRYYETANQTDDGCFYLPEHVLDQPVIFPGQCDETIPVVTNFDVDRYVGLWHDIESYPAAFQDGTCNNALHSAGEDGEVIVYKTQVVNERLQNITGIARFASNDGSAKLVVHFPIAGTDQTVELNYWVLDTDYDTYAFVYSCQNINADQRAVYSWKLSRTKQLSVAAATAISSIVESIPVLNNQYYQVRDQSEAGCFYFPYAEPGVPVVFPGLCDENVAVVSNFDVERYSGFWHEIASYPSVNQQGSCNNAQYTLTEEGTVDVFNTQVLDGFLDTISGTAVLNSTDGSAKLLVSFDIPGLNVRVESPYWVLATDYDNYALVYTCVNLNAEQRGVWSWKLSRTKTLLAEYHAAINQKISEVQVLDDQYFEERDQTDEGCFYLPDLEPGEPVIIVGQCDPNITVVQNFDPERYAGLWHDIASYPAEFQDGTCNNALYTVLPDNSVEVYNTQVIDQLLDTINGSAILATADGSGKLQVTFPVTGTDLFVTSDYWILDTDYETYSLVYSCVNVDTESRRVWSWKLSRTRSLPEAANSAIDAVIDTVPVLHNQYYVTRNQTDEDCFYFPDPVAGQPVVFRGQCNESIPAVVDFDIDRYLGLWHDIESYPSVFQDGTCNNALYSAGDEGVIVFNTQVVQELLQNVTGVARLDSVDGSGKLVVRFNISDSEEFVETNYWVLATDYDSYSLVYTCQNIAEDQRAVWSWKLSRSKQLSIEANTAIAEAMDTIPVLDARYYENTDQTDEGCFFYPEPVQDQPVIFPGQCDLNVPVVENFDAERYAGLWHDVASYPSTSQGGTCSNALYTPTPSGLVEVYNTQVLNQRLDVINGTATLVSADGSGILEVTFPIPGTDLTVNSPYWILATDYETYSLVYSCVNINAEQRAVYSWKLSRTKDLPAAASAAMDVVIASVQVLDEQYYQPKDQSDEGCFYLPYLEEGDPVIFVGQCDPNIPVVQNFDAVRYQGLWHDIESYTSEFQDGTCNNALYTLNDEGLVEVHNTQVIDQLLDNINGTAVLESDGKLQLTFPDIGTDQTVTIAYWILDTDYDSYSLVYSCVNLNAETRRVRSWKLSRTRQLTPEANAAIDQVVDTTPVLNDEYFNVRNQTDEGCFYFPVHVPEQPVVFPGQCDQTVQVVQNFDVERYAGLWYDVESYPQQFQVGGTCANANYTITDSGTVLVYNTHVLEQRLVSITGEARLDNDIGEAKLIVTFPIEGTDFTIDAPYWVLSTDYDNYALVYACTDISEDRRSVTSWKLSRDPSMSAQSESAIAEAMANVQVLDQQYFEERGQSDADCFFYPNNFGGPVYLDGQCVDDTDVPAIENFNAAMYLGLWYEVERFPNEFQTGECTRAQYNNDVITGGIGVINSIVHNELLQTIEGQAVASNDGRGALSVTFPGQEAPVGNNYYILDTDYTNFALVYSCRNIDNETKQVYSWKLSRSRGGLTEAANERIEALVTSNVDLFQDYYEQTDQGDAACFYYPEFDDPSEIVLPGPCNDTVTAMPGLDLERYLGRWFELARYPERYQIGQCARAEYSQDVDSIAVINTIVYEERLETVVGSAVVEDDGSLTVTFPIGEGTQDANYYVLATDYDNYALVYSCRNLADGNRQVTSWKLSRQPYWNAAYDSAIAPVIGSTQGLLEAYYQTSDQSDEACFYIPELDEEKPVVFRGQCDDVEGMPDFDIDRYLGWWHEIKHFPSGFSTGACLSSQYRVINGEYSSVNTSVNGLAATVTSNRLVISSDAPGRLRKTLDNGDVVDMWVLATDYESYSLLYSCQNIDTEYRKVWSAMHSKNRELTEAAEEAMATIIEDIQVLEQQFYLPVDQSDEACFHYPHLDPGQQVILPGQCDEDIAAVPNFDVAEFAGIWYQIEHYPQSWETGSCAAGVYTLDEETGVVTVTNSRVVGEEVRKTVGTAQVVSDDGSGRILVTITTAEGEGSEEVVETTTEVVQILGTDYTSYSLLYTCNNVNQFQRSVGSWKLSRTPVLEPASQTAINNLMATHPELHQPYFVDSDQNDECPPVGAAFVLKATSLLIILTMVVLRLF